jgi:hypothetical protein
MACVVLYRPDDMPTRHRFALLFSSALASVVGCSGSDDAPKPPPGSCQASPTAATGSSSASCTQCAKANCNAELTQSSGSGWESQHIGGDGSCGAYDACACDCYRTSAAVDQLVTCATNCGLQLDSTCQAAMTASFKCIDDQCMSECR